MNWIKASYDGFISPMHLNSFSGIREGTIVEGNRIHIDKEHFLIYDDREIQLPVGALVVVRLDRWFWFMSKEEHKKLQLETERERLRNEEEFRLMSIARREEAEQFNSAYNFPFEWEIGIKAVLSGLTERSMGNGIYKNTVHHVFLKTPVNIDRIRRKAGDFLCTSRSGNNGLFSELRSDEYFHDADGVGYKPKITCKSCLKIAERWKMLEI